METIITLNIAYSISLIILCLSCTVSALELMLVPSRYFNFIYPRIHSIQGNRSKWLMLHSIQIICVLFSLFFFFSNIILAYKISFLLLTSVTLYSYLNREAGKDGADQMRMLALLSFCLGLLIDQNMGKLVPLLFLGAQVLLGYSTSGIAKIISPYWRRGNVLHQIFGTYSYGIPSISKQIAKSPFLEKVMCWGAIATMLLVPVCFLIPDITFLLISLGMIFMFHVCTTVFMGLNDFLYTFPLSYPGLILLHEFFHGIF